MNINTMNIIYSGYDTITFAVQGALSPKAREHLEHTRALAKKKDEMQPLEYLNDVLAANIRPKGFSGGYAYCVDTGPLGQMFSFKDNLGLSQWNGFVKIRSGALLVLGFQEAVEVALRNLELIGFTRVQIGMHRVDYCMDFLNPRIELDPKDFITHSRVTKSVHYSSTEHLENGVRSIVRADHVESITLGKMPNRQIIVYDKRKEAISKKNLHWFKVWGLDKSDITQSVLRVELRAGRDELKKYKIRSFEQLDERIGDTFKSIIQSMRHVEPRGEAKNVSRLPLSPLWQSVTEQVKTRLGDHMTGLDVDTYKEVEREGQARMHEANIMGHIASMSLCKDIPYADIPDVISKHLRERLNVYTCDENSNFAKSYVRARDRYRFIT